MQAAPIIAGAGQIMEGVAAKEAAGAKSDIIGANTRRQVDLTRDQYRKAQGAQIAQAGATGLAMGSFDKIFEESAVNRARTLADIKFAGKVQQAQVEQEGKNALIGGIMSGVSTAVGGIAAAKHKKQMLAQQDSLSTGSIETVRSKVESGKIGAPVMDSNYMLKKRSFYGLR